MPTLTVTSKGQVTLRKEVLRHLGVQPGDKIEVDLLPGKRADMHASGPKKPWREIYGMLQNKTGKVATIEEINETIAKGWAGLLDLPDDEA